MFGPSEKKIQKWEQQGKADKIIKALRSGGDIRAAAASALTRMVPASIGPLVTALSKGDVGTAEPIGDILVDIGEPAVEDLINSLWDLPEDERIATSGVLIRIGEPAMPGLIVATGNPMPNIATYASATLIMMGNRAVGPLCEAINDTAYMSSVRAKVAFILSEIGDRRAIDALIQALEATDLDFGEVAAKAFDGMDGGGEMAELLSGLGAAMGGDSPLFSGFKEDNDVVRKEAAIALGVLRDGKAFDALTKALEDENAEVAEAAKKALENIPAGEQPLAGENELRLLSEPAQQAIAASLRIIDGCVKVTPWGFESSPEAVEAAKQFEAAADLDPDRPLPLYLAAAAYAVGLQGKTAGELLGKLRERFAEYLPAQVMHECGRGLFTYPPYRLGEALPDAIDQQVKANLVVLTRDGEQVQPVLFSRQAPGQLAGSIGEQTRLALHPVYVHDSRSPLLVIVAAIGDNPADPLRAEFLLAPYAGEDEEVHFEPRVRFLLQARRLPLVVLDEDSRILLHREIALSDEACDRLAQAEPLLLTTTPWELPQLDFVATIQAYQQQYPMEQFGLD